MKKVIDYSQACSLPTLPVRPSVLLYALSRALVATRDPRSRVRREVTSHARTPRQRAAARNRDGGAHRPRSAVGAIDTGDRGRRTAAKGRRKGGRGGGKAGDAKKARRRGEENVPRYIPRDREKGTPRPCGHARDHAFTLPDTCTQCARARVGTKAAATTTARRDVAAVFRATPVFDDIAVAGDGAVYCANCGALGPPAVAARARAACIIYGKVGGK